MQRWFPGAVLISLALGPGTLEAAVPDALQVQLLAPPPLVPERPRPRAPRFPPLFPVPQPSFPVPQVRVPSVPPPVSYATGASLPACGRVVLVDPKIDPKFVKPVPDNGVKYTIRELPVAVPCR